MKDHDSNCRKNGFVQKWCSSAMDPAQASSEAWNRSNRSMPLHIHLSISLFDKAAETSETVVDHRANERFIRVDECPRMTVWDALVQHSEWRSGEALYDVGTSSQLRSSSEGRSVGDLQVLDQRNGERPRR